MFRGFWGDSISAVLSSVASLFFGVYLLSIATASFSLEEFNLWVFITSVIAILQICNFGIGITFTRYIAYTLSSAGRSEQNDEVRRKALVKQSIQLHFCVSIVFVLMGVGLTLLITKYADIFTETIYASLVLPVICIAGISNFLTVSRVISEGHGRIKIVHYSILASLIICATFLYFIDNVSLNSILYLQLFAIIFAYVITGYVNRALLTGLSTVMHFDFILFKEIFSYSWRTGFTSSGAIVNTTIGPIIVGIFFNASQSSQYMLIKKLFDIGESISGAIVNTQIARLASLSSHKQFNQLLRYIGLLILFSGLVAFVFLTEKLSEILLLMNSNILFENYDLLSLLFILFLLQRFGGLIFTASLIKKYIIDHKAVLLIAISFPILLFFLNSRFGIYSVPLSLIGAQLISYALVFNAAKTISLDISILKWSYFSVAMFVAIYSFI